MRIWTLLLLRVSLGWLLVIWGADKVFNVEHGMAVANKFYFGFLAAESVMRVGGALQMLVGLAVVVGFARRWVYPLQVLLNGASLLAVKQSVIDPWSWIFEGSNVLFYPSLIIFAASLMLIAYRDEDRFVFDKKGV
ncbi:DoxX family membrane protein [Pseudomonas sp. GD03696]|uniref:DoxX family protein n=1 Tax=Pseudomonas sp. GD03696 TaxID=2975368 RepID=UPI00244B6EE5|nr:DoxX family membrane protein [Pseudomonas sp. GD03696]MDH1933229.1 DoxX family membrane protein [Pseudomonas sp. GD03696]